MGTSKIARPAFRELDGKFRFDLEPLADQGDALEQGRPNHLVTGFHIGQIEVRNYIAEQSQKMVPHLVTKKQDPPLFAGKKPGTKDRVGLLVQENVYQFQQVAGVILEISIM